jgi:hypothetical protein
MSFSPTSAQVLFMLGLVFGKREPRVSDARPQLPAGQMKTLESHGLIRLERRGRSSHLILTEQGWAWAQEHLDAPITPAGAAPGVVLAALLPHLKAFLDAKGGGLGEFLRSSQALAEDPVAEERTTTQGSDGPLLPPRNDSDLERFVSALRRLDGGEHQFVLLADLRSALADLPRSSFDAAALALQAEGRIALFRIDEPWRRSPTDEAAAIDVAGTRYHSAYFKR